MSPFWNPAEGRLRALWRLCVQAVLAVALGLLPVVVIAEPLTAFHRRGLFLPGCDHNAYDRIINMLVGPLLTIAIVGSVAIAGRWLDHRPWSDFGTRVDGEWWRGLTLGLGLGALLMTLVFAFEYAAGWVTVSGVCVTTLPGLTVAGGLAFSLVKVTCVATYEEFVSRGYQLRNLIEGIHLPLGVAASSLIFALLHFSTENMSLFSLAGLWVNGILLTVAVLVTGRLSTAIGLHFTWNIFQGAVFGFPVSGDKEGASLIGIQQLGPELLTGGAFGPEAGLIGIAASLAGIFALLCLQRRGVALANRKEVHRP